MIKPTKRFRISIIFYLVWILAVGILSVSTVTAAEPIRHDAEHYVLLHQYADQWAAEDQEIDKKLAEIREKNGGKRPNIVYILLDDMGFGEYGIPIKKEWPAVVDGGPYSLYPISANNVLLV